MKWILVAVAVLAVLAAGVEIASGRRAEAELVALVAREDSLEAELELARAREAATAAKAAELEALHQAAVQAVPILNDTTIILEGKPVVVAPAIINRIQVAGIRGNQWKVLAEERAGIIARQDSLLDAKDERIRILEQLRPKWYDRANLTVGYALTPDGLAPGAVVGVKVADVRDAARWLLRR